MAPYSMDLRTRVLADSDAGLPSKDVAVKFRVSRSWVDRLKQRRRETGEVEPRPQRVFRKQAFAGQEDRLRAWWTPSRIGRWRNSVRRYTARPVCRRCGARWIGSR